MYIIRKSTGNVTEDNNVTIRDVELPAEIHVWEVDEATGEMHHAATLSLTPVRIELTDPDGMVGMYAKVTPLSESA